MKKLSRYFKKYKWQTGGATLFTALQIVVEFMLVGLVIEQVALKDQMAQEGWALLALAFVVGTLILVCKTYFLDRLSAGVAKALRDDLFLKTQELDLLTLQSLGKDNLLDCLTEGVEQVKQGFPIVLDTVISALVATLGGITLIGRLNPALLIPYFCLVPVAAIVSGVWVKLVAKQESNSSGKNGKARGNLFLCLILLVMAAALLWTSAIANGLLGNQTLNALQWAAALQYGILVLLPFAQLSGKIQALARYSVWNKKIHRVFVAKNQVPEQEHFITPKTTGLVELRRVSLLYPGRFQEALNDVSFSIQPGEITAIVGPASSGKTSLLLLLLRMVDATQGEVLVDGIDVKQQSKKALRNRLSVAWQQPTLFSGTVAQAVADGNKDMKDQQIAQILELVQLKNDPMLEQIGKTTWQQRQIAQDGENLTWQQRKKISLARALARQASIYLFDECFEKLENADSIWRDVQSRLQGNTMVIATRWVNWARRAHKIVVLDQGKVVAVGRHEQLLMDCPVYQMLAKEQLREGELQQ